MLLQEKIQCIRMKLGLSQKEMAHKSGLQSQSLYSKIESGQISLKMKLKEDILLAEGMTAEEFDKWEGRTVFSFHQEQGEITGQVVNSPNNSDELMEIINEVTAPYKAHIAQLEEINRFLRDIIDKKD